MNLLALVALQLAALAVLLLAAAGLGALALGRRADEAAVEWLALRIALGLGLAGSLLGIAAAMGGLRRPVVLALAALAALGGARRIGAAFGGPGRPGGRAEARRAPLLALACALAPALVWGLYPPLAYDAAVYHLPYARAFAEAHRLVELPDLIFPVFPQLVETLFAGLLSATGADTPTHLVQWSAVAAAALLLYGAGRRLFSARAGLWAAALWLAHPLVHYQAASAYVDATLALFVLLALCAWERWRERPEPAWLVTAGAALGFAAATKYLGLLWIALFALLTLVAAPRGRRWRGACALLAVAVLVAGPWYLRIYRATGNPVHPFLGPLFEGGRASAIDRQLGLADGDSAGDLAGAALRRVAAVARRPAELARFAWRASFAPDAFDRQSPLAPWPLLLTPLAALFAFGDRRLLRWLSLTLAFAVLWTTTQPRFQLGGAALLALAGAGGLELLARRFAPVGHRLATPWAGATLALLLIAPGPLYALYKLAALPGPPPATPSARQDFLDRQVAGHAALRRLEEVRGERYVLYVAGAPDLTYHARGRLLGQARSPYRFGRIRALLGDAAALHRELAAMGADHFLAVGAPRARLPRDAAFTRLFTPLYEDERCALFALAPGAERAAAEAGSPP